MRRNNEEKKSSTALKHPSNKSMLKNSNSLVVKKEKDEKPKKYEKISQAKYQEWEANRRKKFNNILEELRQVLPNCNPCPKVEIVQAAIAFVKKQTDDKCKAKDRNEISNEVDCSFKENSKVEKLRKQNVILTFVLKEAGIKIESDKVKGEVSCYYPVSCSMPETHKVKVRKIRINLSSLSMDKENNFPSIQKTMMEKACQTAGKLIEIDSIDQEHLKVPYENILAEPVTETSDVIGVLNCKSFTNHEYISLPVSTDAFTERTFETPPNFVTDPLLASTAKVCNSTMMGDNEVTSNLNQEMYAKEQIIVEGDEKNGSVTVKLIPEITSPCKHSSNNSDSIYIHAPINVADPRIIIQGIDSHLQGNRPKFSQITDSDQMNLLKKKMVILKVQEGDQTTTVQRNIILPQDTNFQVTPSLTNAPIMSTGITLFSKDLFQAHPSTSLFGSKVLYLYSKPRLKRIAPKPVDQDSTNRVGSAAPFDSQFFVSLKKRYQPKSSSNSPHKKLKVSSEDNQQRQETIVSSAVKVETPSVSDNSVLYSIKEIITTSFSEQGNDVNECENDELDGIMNLPDDMPCVIPETIRNTELEGSSVSEEHLVQMLCSMDEDDRSCSFSPPNHSLAYKSIGNLDNILLKQKDSRTKFNNSEEVGKANGKKAKVFEISKNALENLVPISEPETSSTSSNYSIMSLCVSSKTDEKMDPLENKISFSKSDCWPRLSSNANLGLGSDNKAKKNTSLKIDTTMNDPVSNNSDLANLTKNIDSDSKPTSSNTNLSVSSLISHSSTHSESALLKSLDLQPLLELPGPSISNTCPSTISLLPSLYLHPPQFATPPLPPVGLPTLSLPTLPTTHHSSSIPSFSFSCNSVTSKPIVSTSSSPSSFCFSHPVTITRATSLVTNTSSTIAECSMKKDSRKLIVEPTVECLEKTKDRVCSTSSQVSSNTNTITPISTTTYSAPTSAQSVKLPFSLAVAPTIPLLSTVASTEATKSIFSNSVSKSVFSLSPMTSYTHPFPFCPLSLSDAPTTFSFTLTRNSSSASYCSSHALTTTSNSNKGLKCSETCVTTSAEAGKGVQPYGIRCPSTLQNKEISLPNMDMSAQDVALSIASDCSTSSSATIFYSDKKQNLNNKPISGVAKWANPHFSGNSTSQTVSSMQTSNSISSSESNVVHIASTAESSVSSSNNGATTYITSTTIPLSSITSSASGSNEPRPIYTNTGNSAKSCADAIQLLKTVGSNCLNGNSNPVPPHITSRNKEGTKLTDINEIKLPLPPLSSYLIEESFPILTSNKPCNKSSSLQDRSCEGENEDCSIKDKIVISLKEKSFKLNSSNSTSSDSLSTDISSISSVIISKGNLQVNDTVVNINPMCSITHMLGGHLKPSPFNADNYNLKDLHCQKSTKPISVGSCFVDKVSKNDQLDICKSTLVKPLDFTRNTTSQFTHAKTSIMENSETDHLTSLSSPMLENKNGAKNDQFDSDKKSLLLHSYNVSCDKPMSSAHTANEYGSIASNSTKELLVNASLNEEISLKSVSENVRASNIEVYKPDIKVSVPVNESVASTRFSLASCPKTTILATSNEISLLASAKSDNAAKIPTNVLSSANPTLNFSHNNSNIVQKFQNRESSALGLSSEMFLKSDNLTLSKNNSMISPQSVGEHIVDINNKTKMKTSYIVNSEFVRDSINNNSLNDRNTHRNNVILQSKESGENLGTLPEGDVKKLVQIDNTRSEAIPQVTAMQNTSNMSKNECTLYQSVTLPKHISSKDIVQPSLLQSDMSSESSNNVLGISTKNQSDTVRVNSNVIEDCNINNKCLKENVITSDSSSAQTFYKFNNTTKNTDNQCHKENKVDDLLQKVNGSSPRNYSNELNQSNQLSSSEAGKSQSLSNYNISQDSGQQLGTQLVTIKQSNGLQQSSNPQVNKQPSPGNHMHLSQHQLQESHQLYPIHQQHQITQQMTPQQLLPLPQQLPHPQQQSQHKQLTQLQQHQAHQQQHQTQQLQQQYSMNVNIAQKQQSSTNTGNNHIVQNGNLKDNCGQPIGVQQSNTNVNSQQMIVQQQQQIIQQQTHHHQIHTNQLQQHLPQGNSHLQPLNNFESPTIDILTERGNLKNQHPVQHHLSPMGSNSGYIQTFDYNPYYRKQPQSPRTENRHNCYAYKQVQHFQQDVLNDGITSANHTLIQPPFLESNDEAGIRGDDEPPSDHLSGFSVSHLVSPFNETRKSNLIGLKEQQPSNSNEEKSSKDTVKKCNSRKGEKSRGSNGNKGNSHTGDTRRRSPARSVGSQHSNNSLTMWNNKQSTTKQGQNYSAEALISSQNYVRPSHRQAVNQNYHFIPNQMYQSSYSAQPMKNFVQNSSFGYSGHDRSGVCNADYNFQLHSQTSGALPYGTNVPYMTPSYPYQNLPPTSSSMLSGDIMAGSHHPGAYPRLHDINAEHSNFSSNTAFPLALDPQEMCGGSGLVGSSMATMGVRVPTDPPFSICSSTSYPRLHPPKSTNGALTSTGNGLSSNGKRAPRYSDANVMGSGMGTPTNFLEGISHISLHSLTPPCDDTSIMHSNFLAGSSRHQSNFLLGADNLVPLNTSQYPGHAVNSGLSVTSTPNSLNPINGSSHPITMGPPAPTARSGPPAVPHMLTHGTNGHMSFNPLRMMDRQQINVAPPPAGPHLSSSLSNFNLTSIFPEIDGKTEDSNSPMSSSTSRHGAINHNDGGVNSGHARLPMVDALLVPSDINKARLGGISQADSGQQSQTTTLNNAMNNIFPSSHQVGLCINPSLSLTSSGLNFTSSGH